MSLFLLIATSHQFSFLFLFKRVRIRSLHWRVNPSYAILEWYPWGSNIPGCCSKDYSAVKFWLAVSQFIVVSIGFRRPCWYTERHKLWATAEQRWGYTRGPGPWLSVVVTLCTSLKAKVQSAFSINGNTVLFFFVCVLIFDKSRKDTFWLLTWLFFLVFSDKKKKNHFIFIVELLKLVTFLCVYGGVVLTI